MSGVARDQDVDIDLGQLVRAVWARRLRILTITLVGASVAFAGAKIMSPQYRSETRILIEPRAPAFASTQQANDTSAGPLMDELNIASQVQLLQSADLLKKVINNLKLYNLPEFDDAASGSAMSSILVKLHLKKNPLENPPEERVIDAFVERLQVYQVPGSRVIGINFTSKDPKLAAAIPNAMANVYLSTQSGAKLDSNSEATRWLEPEIEGMRLKVSEAEKKVAEYRTSHGLLQTNGTTTFPAQQLNDISAELTRVRGDKANAEARAQAVRNALKSGEASDTLPDIMSSQAIQRLKGTESGLQSQVSDLQTSLLNNHPRLKSLRAQLSDIRTQIRQETQKILASIENESKVADLRASELERQSETVQATSARAGEDEVGLNALEREANAQRQLLETYLVRYREAASRADSNSSPADARIVSRAVEPVDPYFPKVVPIVVVAAVATLIMSAIVIMLAELFSGRALRPTDAASETIEAEAVVEEKHVPQAAPIAAAGGRPVQPSMLAVVADEEDTIEDVKAAEEAPEDEPEDDNEFSVASVADYLTGSRAPLAIAISPTGDSGSAATVSLTRMLADAGRRVILIDMTGSGYPTELMAEDQAALGVTDLLCGEAAFGDTIHGDRFSDAHLIPQGQSDVRRAMRGVDRLSLLLDALAAAYDLVVVECGSADVAGVSRLTRSRDVEIILSLPEVEETIFVALMTEFQAAGYERVVLMSGGEGAEQALGRAA
ncbi:chain-length determining protein [Rhizobium leguminosarum]|uniref:Transmembrane succinoglycan biosynthesis transport protein n=1 Tax=Rhizobium johnstonii (strain DSM 114642 / LMG 32736 / 3841) TaxID=216596 RepID=Q1MIQ1_RHIJ3|nr:MULTISPECIES: Wzz/FepE/Etk N-terminal domain-containing protein [Rhizobium]WSH09643.1 Wzz/FepE/Etk N-terminal domain-containing protein [Rhizobium johnstonii]NEI92742.1 chain-length determining protein [Rhizobium leguminosarum]NEJ76756.1 chain-length determining protein [Rhizobium leguminosarum]TBF39796.1 chain-length determining protein [Rhizobium leguminosarum]TBF56168.1 chain-length determining protein [Rhizobium leguminosarum]